MRTDFILRLSDYTLEFTIIFYQAQSQKLFINVEF